MENENTDRGAGRRTTGKAKGWGGLKLHASIQRAWRSQGGVGNPSCQEMGDPATRIVIWGGAHHGGVVSRGGRVPLHLGGARVQ